MGGGELSSLKMIKKLQKGIVCPGWKLQEQRSDSLEILN